MPDTNQIITLLQERPCTKNELPYRPCMNTMSMASRKRIRRIRVSGRRERKTTCRRFQTVYYLEGDDDRAIKKFVEANVDVLDALNMRSNTVIDSGLTKELAQKVRSATEVSQ